MLAHGQASEDGLKRIDAEIRLVVNDSAEFAQTDPEPAAEELYTDVTVGV